MNSGIWTQNKHNHISPLILLPASDVCRSSLFTEVLKCPHYIKHVTDAKDDISVKSYKILLFPMHKKETHAMKYNPNINTYLRIPNTNAKWWCNPNPVIAFVPFIACDLWKLHGN